MATSSSRKSTKATGGGGGSPLRSLTAFCLLTRSSTSSSPSQTHPRAALSPLVARSRSELKARASSTSRTTLTSVTSLPRQVHSLPGRHGRHRPLICKKSPMTSSGRLARPIPLRPLRRQQAHRQDSQTTLATSTKS